MVTTALVRCLWVLAACSLGSCGSGKGATTRESATEQEAPKQKSPAEKQAALQKSITVDLGGGVKMELVLIPAGSFRMGSEKGDDTEKPVHEVKIPKPFYMGRYEVTQKQWEAVMGKNPSRFKDPKKPVENVDRQECLDFVRKVTQKTGRNFSLPSEAEWEYACRAGSATEFCFGDDAAGLDAYAWYLGNAGKTTHPVGQKKSNAWGLFDMHGNVCEWCMDFWHKSYKDTEDAPNDGSAWVSGGVSGRHGTRGPAYVVRGGSRGIDAVGCSSAARLCRGATLDWVDYGLRVVLRDSR